MKALGLALSQNRAVNASTVNTLPSPLVTIAISAAWYWRPRNAAAWNSQANGSLQQETSLAIKSPLILRSASNWRALPARGGVSSTARVGWISIINVETSSSQCTQAAVGARDLQTASSLLKN